MPEHAVIVHFQYGSTDLGALLQLEDQLETAIADADAGEYDGNEIRSSTISGARGSAVTSLPNEWCSPVYSRSLRGLQRLRKPYGWYSSAEASWFEPPEPPAMRTRPSESSVAVCLLRAVSSGPVRLKVPVLGSYSSAEALFL
jgi:hypothetical protein